MGYKSQEIKGKNWFDVMVPENIRGKVRGVFQQLLSGDIEPVEYLENALLNKSGEERIISFHNTVIRDNNDKIISILFSFDDITERKKAEENAKKLQDQLLQLQKMEAVGQLAGGMAHDFNNMLTVIMGNANLALAGLNEDSDNYIEFREIMDASERAKDLTMKLLTFSRQDKLNTQSIPVNEITVELSGVLSRTINKNIKIENISKCESFVDADKNQILQMLINICNNGADAMPNGGKLTIESEERDEDGICDACGESYSGKYVVLQITDTGTGMSDDVRKKALNPFFTTKGVGKGTGLGLSVTQGIIKGHNGHINIHSEIDVGTSIKIMLPLVEGATEAESSKVADKIFTGTETILVVDDEKSVLNLAGRILESTGYKPILAEDGKQALELFKKHRKKISLVIMDMIMPGMSGKEVYQKLKEIEPDVKVILSSGYSEDGQAADLIRQGVNAFVQKPFSMHKMSKTIREVLDT